jgi:ParB family transcriptional regulator, chromosome partitioning protein
MATKTARPPLGRGLASLLGNIAVPPPGAQPEPAVPSNAQPGLRQIPLDLLEPNPFQPRMTFTQESLDELADSIRARGILQPILARAHPTQPERFYIIAGERRWRAAQIAGLTEIPAVVRRIADEAAIAMALIENIQRENLNPLEEARALQRLITEFDLTHQEAAVAVGRSRAGVSNLLRLLELAPEVCDLVERREIEMGHARALLALGERRQQAEVAVEVAKKGLSVRETEAKVRRMLEPEAPSEASAQALLESRDPNVDRLEQELADKLGAKVAIQHSAGGKGKLVVAYNSLDELDGILAHIQ